MPHIIVIAAGAMSLFYAYRWVCREADRVETALRRTDRRVRRNTQHGTPLAFDAAAGVYRPIE
jgi:hypothetical protein